jgi:hypothetical protein
MTAALIDDAAATAAPPAASVARTLLVVAGVVTALWLVLLFIWQDAPFAFTYDDAYYYFGIARNVAAGHGSTFDGINVTNGYHPLWLLISVVPFALGFDDLDAARLLLAVQLVFGWGLSLALLAKLLDRDLTTWPRVGGKGAAAPDPARRRVAVRVLAVLFALVAVNPFVVKIFVNGLETGITVTLLTALLLVGSRPRTSWLTATTHRWRLGVGVLLGALFLGRTDTILLLGCLFLWCGAEAWRDRSTNGSLPLGALVELFAPATLVVLAYLAVNASAFGTPFQISGLVKRAPLTPTTVLTFGIIAGVAVAIAIRGFRTAHGRRPKRAPRFVHVAAFATRTGWFGAFCVLLVGYYTVLQTQIWAWYFAPLVLYAIVLFLLAMADMVEVALGDARASASPWRSVAPLAAVFVVLLGGALVYEAAGFSDPTLLSIQLADRDAGRWLRANTPDDAVAASWDAGATGYFSHRHVMNLDGLVNSKEFYDASQTGRQGLFVACNRMTLLTNHGGADAREEQSLRAFIRTVYGDDAARDAKVVYRQPFLFSGTTAGAEGTDSSGTRELASWVLEVPRKFTAANCM